MSQTFEEGLMDGFEAERKEPLCWVDGGRKLEVNPSRGNGRAFNWQTRIDQDEIRKFCFWLYEEGFIGLHESHDLWSNAKKKISDRRQLDDCQAIVGPLEIVQNDLARRFPEEVGRDMTDSSFVIMELVLFISAVVAVLVLLAIVAGAV